MLAKTQSGNSRHSHSKYSCPKCGHVFNIVKEPFMIMCSRCKSNLKGYELIVKNK